MKEKRREKVAGVPTTTKTSSKYSDQIMKEKGNKEIHNNLVDSNPKPRQAWDTEPR